MDFTLEVEESIYRKLNFFKKAKDNVNLNNSFTTKSQSISY